MSLYNKKTLALALALAMAAPSAYAYNVTTNDGEVNDLKPEIVAVQVGSEVTMTESVEINVELGDIIVGRSTGFQLLVTLQDGAKFGDVAPVLAPGSALAEGWAINLAAGGTKGSTQAQFTFEPESSASRVSTGVLGVIASLDLESVATTNGATTRARFLVRDPVSTATLHDYTPNLIVRSNGLTISCAPQDLPVRIDVGESADFAPKTGFVESPYMIGGADTDTGALGEITVEATSQLDLVGTDTLTSVISGNFAGFDAIYLAPDDSCTVTTVAYDINTAGDTATLEASVDDLTGQGIAFGATGGSATLCVTVDGETQIAAQSFNVQNTMTVGDEEIDIAGGSCPVAPLAYNGSVVNVYHVNPAGNSTAQSFVRVINPSNLEGRVTVVGWDDNGNAAGPISFNLPARSSKQFNSVDLEEGAVSKGITGSFGNGAGKWRLEVTGEFDGMLVQGLNRNQNDGTVTNLTDADAQMEQDFLHRGNFF